MKKYLLTILILTLLSPTVSYGALQTGYYINKNVDLVPNDKNENKKVILITIDDGPSKYEKGMVEVLIKHKAKAIFFINGIHNKDYRGVIKSTSDLGFTIGNHTWSHINIKKEKDLNKLKKEIDDNTELIKKETGSNPKFFRAPYGVNTTYSKDIVKKYGMISMNWSGAAKDWEKNTKDQKIFLKNVLDGLHSGEILLIHEHEWTAKYLDDILTTLEQKGYSFADPTQINQ